MRHPSLRPSAGNREEELERRIAALEARVRRIPATTSASAVSATCTLIVQASHGMSVGDAVRHSGSAWVRSQADTEEHAVVHGVVVDVPSPGVFVLATAGRIEGLAGLSAGTVYYLSHSTAGALVSTAPSGIVVPVLRADSASSAVLAIGGRNLRGWGDVQVRSATHSLGGTYSDTWVSTGGTDGAVFSPDAIDSSGYGSTFGFYAGSGSGVDIGIEKNVAPDVAGVHNPDDLEVHFRLTPGTAANQAMLWSGTAWAPQAIPSGALPDSGVTPGSYGPAWTATVDAKGRVTAAATTAVSASWNADQTKKAEGTGMFAFSGSFWSFSMTWYTGAPIYNAKWLRGSEIADQSALDGTGNLDRVLWYDRTNQKWTNLSLFGAATTGAILYKDTSDTTYGYKTLTAAAGALVYRSSVLQWATIGTDEIANSAVTKAKMENGAACSVIGRSANSSGVTADISAGGNGRVLQRNSDTVGFSADQVLGTGHRTATATVGSLDIAISTDGDAVRISDAEDGIAIYDRSVSTTVPVIKIALGHASLTSTARQLKLKEIDVCDSGTAKKMLILASDPY